MEKKQEAISIPLPDIGNLVRLITMVIIFSIFFALGIIISLVEGSFVFDQIGYFTLTPLLISGLLLTLISTIVLGFLFLKKNWRLKYIH